MPMARCEAQPLRRSQCQAACTGFSVQLRVFVNRGTENRPKYIMTLITRTTTMGPLVFKIQGRQNSCRGAVATNSSGPSAVKRLEQADRNQRVFWPGPGTLYYILRLYVYDTILFCIILYNTTS